MTHFPSFAEQFAAQVRCRVPKRPRVAKRPAHSHEVPATPPVSATVNTWALAA